MSEVYAPAGTVSATTVSRFTAAEAATGTFGTMDRATQTELLDRTRYLDQTGQIFSAVTVYLGDTSNANATLGLTINQGAADNEILSLKSSDIAHGITTDTETDTYGLGKKVSATLGGLLLCGLSESKIGLSLMGSYTTGDTGKATSADAAVTIVAALKSGTGTVAPTTNENMMAIQGLGTTRFIFDWEGSAHADLEWVAF